MLSRRAVYRPLHRYYYSTHDPKHTGSDKLFADAEREERDGSNLSSTGSTQSQGRLQTLLDAEQNWDGDESIQHVVLRMLVDKHKPLRTGVIQSADQKLKSNLPKVIGAQNVEIPEAVLDKSLIAPASGSWATQPLLPAVEGHQPWHTEFKAPSHSQSSIKLAAIPAPSSSSSLLPQRRYGTGEIGKKEKEMLKRTQTAMRLDRVRESTLDYRLGLGVKKALAGGGRPNPTTARGWAGLAENKIEQAIASGAFKTIAGRGKPIKRVTEEFNPFIAREEFLMNRIVQRNGAVPPWIELQRELDTAVSTMRAILLQNWSRRAVRELSISTTHSLASIKAFRDSAWLAQQASFHTAAINEVNALVRKFNGMAPYISRRPYHDIKSEMARVYEECAEDVWHEIYKGKKDALPGKPKAEETDMRGEGVDVAPHSMRWLWDLLSRVLRRFLRASSQR